MAVLSVAEKFHLLPQDVEDRLTTDQLAELLAYFSIKEEETKKARARQQRTDAATKGKQGRRGK